MILQAKRRLGVTSMVISHDIASAFKVADRLAVLNRGKVVFTAKRDELDAGSLKETYFRYTGAAH